ncbi:hypothetical protein OII53_06180 [Achromobacter ruhlandii]|uniref:hypothetical protein n=1 Tax=Achromobacter ruhlandii TaxID=72557 RepID=UPI0021F184B9|nr:hypothetical protein [Achromobacter ruhlandii]MCV6795798.1 hypothetical protein [Achromobacter ruhlandii]MCV6802223.1 hypothetical protein [Achromobacter ruhlandii]MCV6807770.1 hypothetical protein [Achromobacter ruhlandii]MCV6818111.1 hypothetical protein [Achromobacter ruhlandii]
MRSLKNLIQELEVVLDQNSSQLDTEVFASLKLKIDSLKQEVESANAAQRRQLAAEALRLLAVLLSVVTNVMTLLK